ncbi:aspartate aminotransferase family protein (plasmid) [Agrobacterium vitis]|uniref:aspartate aminotransferase family protein n=1 Tax=Rhizobium/Agrobacterium group TaxID=227290 RepID=UPI0015733BCB|nr:MULTISPECIES: aspartate aminotransferase family protein [Rhizobium/Agrobacterium group]MCF1450291.1 aspartate aminotransferase family protein [Allorhizobium ampelinum]NSZ56030.1 aspartate aminotransferase family protein [Agrobacterium vitis]NTA35281.1 aspartate aminotransferase family protein [Agrobacterium vitis]BCH68258.1 aspartate aminotransferase family protein [Agrobacterium vitis]
MANETANSNSVQSFWRPFDTPSETLMDPPRRVASGDGVYVTDDGGRLLDAVGGLWNVNLGYSQPSITQAITKQLEELAYTSVFKGNTTGVAEELAQTLVDDWFGADGMARVFFTSGGSDSVETALRLARQYWKILGQNDRYKFISLKRSYHGTHFGGSSVSGGAHLRRNYEPLMPGCFHIPAPITYRNAFDETSPERLAQICVRLLEEEIIFQGPETVAAFIAEPVQGAGGIIVPHESFWPMVREVCDKYGVLLIADEVVTGFGRTGFDSGVRGWGVKPDMMILAKAITSGYFPFGATMIGEKVAQAFENTKGPVANVGHGYTNSGHPAGCAAGLATLKLTRELGVVENAGPLGERLMAGLQRMKDKHELIGDVRGRGLMAAVELVSDRSAKTPLGAEMMKRFVKATAANGVLVRQGGHMIILSPPLTIQASQIDEIVDAMDKGLSSL